MKEWLFYSLLVVLGYGIAGLFSKLSTNYIGWKSAAIWDVFGALLVGLVLLAVVGFKPDMNVKGVTYGILAGIFVGMAAAMFFLAASKGKISLVATASALYPVVTIFLGFLILNETVSIKQGIGMAMAIFSIFLISS